MMDIDKGTLLQMGDYAPESVGILVLADHPRPEDLGTLTRIADELRDEQEDADQPLDIFEPENSPYGPVLFIEHGLEEPELEQFLDSLGERMDAAGLTGRLTAVQRQWPDTELPHQIQAFSAGLCTSVPNGQHHPPQAVIDHALQWCQVPNAKYYVRFGNGQYQVSAESRSRLLQQAVEGRVGVGITAYAGRDQLRRVLMWHQGTAVYEERYAAIDDPGTWRTGLEDMTNVLKETAASLEYGFVRRQRYGLAWPNFVDVQWPAKPHLQNGFVYYARKWSHKAIPDAFGAMILSPSHHWTPPTPDWTVTPVAGNRVLVRHRNPEALFSNAHPDEETVTRMRADMAPILMTDAMTN
jgi:hypothetical protein